MGEQARLIREEVERKKAEFSKGIAKVVPELKKRLEKKGTISKFEIMPPQNFYYAAKLYLWDNGIYIETKTKDKEPALLMRNRNPDDKLFRTGDEQLAHDVLTVFGKPPRAMTI
jgi:hypothetical protein